MSKPTLPRYESGWPTPARGVCSGSDTCLCADCVAAREAVSDYRERYPHMAQPWSRPPMPVVLTESPPCQLFTSRRIVVPSRRQRRRSRVITALSVLLVLAALGAGLALQARWDAACERAQPGTRWDGDLWACVSK